jgi:hypothetical protein
MEGNVSSSGQLMQDLSALTAEASQSLDAEYYDEFFELLQRLGIFEPGDSVPVPIEIWRALAQAIADQSGYRIVLQATILESVGIEPSSFRALGYREVYFADPMLFVQEAEE